MELRDYARALRRYWLTWAVVTLLGVSAALAVIFLAPRSYTATAQVFVSSAGKDTSGWQFVSQRVATYPQVAVSRDVLAPVMNDLELTGSLNDLRNEVSATNPPDTSQIIISVTTGDPTRASDVANAVASQLGTVVERLERPVGGDSPVDLSVTDTASPPTAPSFPTPKLVLPLGIIVGLALGAAAAIIRSRFDTRVHDEEQVRYAWGAGGEQLVVLQEHGKRMRRRRRRPAGGPATMVARQLESMADEQSVRILVLPATPDGLAAAWAVLTDVAAQLERWKVPCELIGFRPGAAETPKDDATVHISLGTPLASQRQFRRISREYDGVVVVVDPGRTHRVDIAEIRSVLAAAGIDPMTVVLPRRKRRRRQPPTAARVERGAPAGEAASEDDAATADAGPARAGTDPRKVSVPAEGPPAGPGNDSIRPERAGMKRAEENAVSSPR